MYIQPCTHAGARPLAIPTSTNPPAGALSCGSARLSFDALLAQRPVVATAFCPGSEPLLLAAYAPVGAQLGAAALLKDHTLSSKGVMVVWDLSAPSTPQVWCWYGVRRESICTGRGSMHTDACTRVRVRPVRTFWHTVGVSVAMHCQGSFWLRLWPCFLSL